MSQVHYGRLLRSIHNAASGFPKDGPGRENGIKDLFGCKKCPWVETEACPHVGEVTKSFPHANGICSQRVKYVKELFDTLHSNIRLAQVDVAARLIYVDESLFSEYVKTKDKTVLMPYSHISRNLILHLDKMRRQDEGIKIRAEGLEEHETARRIIDVSAKVLEAKGIKEIGDLKKEILKENDDKQPDTGTKAEDSGKV